MPQNILLASLGDHPAVVLAMIKALRDLEHINIDKVHIFYPQQTGKNIERDGLLLVRQHLDPKCESIPHGLGFPDANTRETSIAFLQLLAGVLAQYDDPSRHHVYISLAGGRKNMSALMALVAQFFPVVRGVYHLLDRYEDSANPTFPTIEEIVLYMSAAEMRQTFDPSLDRLNLIRVPYPGAFSNFYQLQQILKHIETNDSTFSLPLTPEAESFYRSVFAPNRTYSLLQVWLSKSAYEQYLEFANKGSNFASEFMKCFQQMQDPNRLRENLKGASGQFHFFKRRRTPERPFYYTTPNPIHLYPQKPLEKAIITGLSIEQGDGSYKPDADYWLSFSDIAPYRPLSALNPKERTLVVPLGRSPMIATQTYQMLQESEDEGHPRIPTVAVIYPEQNEVIENGVRLLEKQFTRRNVEFIRFPIANLQDIDSAQACEEYLKEMLRSIDKLQQKYPDRPVTLSLSGGRKGMSALTLFAAQRAGIERIYHTLITDTMLEKTIERETSTDALNRLPTDEARANRLFLEGYDRSKFHLFTIPVIGLVTKSN